MICYDFYLIKYPGIPNAYKYLFHSKIPEPLLI